MCWRETRPGPRQRSTMWSSAGLGWAGLGRVARAGAGEEQQPVVGTTALQLSALLCRCVGHVTPHRRTRRAAPGRAAPLHTPGTTPLRQFESRRRVERRHRVTARVYLPASAHKPCIDITRNIKFIRMWDLLLVPIRGSTVTIHSVHQIRSVKVVMRTRDAAAVTVWPVYLMGDQWPRPVSPVTSLIMWTSPGLLLLAWLSLAATSWDQPRARLARDYLQHSGIVTPAPVSTN